MKLHRIFALFLICAQLASAKSYTVTSPDKLITATVSDDSGITLAVSHDGKTILEPSAIAMDFRGITPASKIKKSSKTSKSETIQAPFYRQKEFSVDYSALTLTFNNGTGLEVRAYNQGVAYRFTSALKEKQAIVVNETADYELPGDPTVWLPYSTNDEKPFAMAYQNIYDRTAVSHAKDKYAFLPATVDYSNGLKMTILESDLKSYPGMWLKADTVGISLDAKFAPYPAKTDFYPWRMQEYVTEATDYIAKVDGKRTYPWRILAITTDDTQMPVNDLVYALAEPSKVADTSWIRTGKVAWDWWNDWGLKGVPFKAGINNDTYKYYIDFAADNGIEFVVLDEGWYDPKSGDMLTVIPDINLEELIAYGKKKGVGILLWTVFNVLDNQLEEACKKYSDMGVVGFKVDFLDRDDQTAIEMTHRLAEACAKHHLTLDYHGIYKPVGLNRTYPNILNYEGVFGMEEVKWTDIENNMPLYDVTFPFIRMMAGQVDYTPGAMHNASMHDWKAIYRNPVSMGTRSHQLAAYIVHDSPFTMLCDAPTNYLPEEECLDFITNLPVIFDETKVISGVVGEHIVTARRRDGSWYVGGMTNWDPRDITVDFSFLPEGQKYKLTMIKDGINADEQAEDYAKSIVSGIDHNSKLNIHLASGGGFVMRLDPEAVPHGPVTAVPAQKRGQIPDFYRKYIESDGFYIVSSENVSDEALGIAGEIVGHMLLKRPDVKKHMVDRGCHLLVIGKDEQTCDIPEYKWVCTEDPDSIAYINWRARGFGGAPEDELSSGCGEENLLALTTDKYVGENILIHEFAHLIHMIGINETDPTFDARLTAAYENAKAKNLWDGTYALSNKEEYFAESVQSFFNCNRYSETPNGIHNWVNRRHKLKAYDPEMYALLSDYFYEIEIPIKNQIHK